MNILVVGTPLGIMISQKVVAFRVCGRVLEAAAAAAALHMKALAEDLAFASTRSCGCLNLLLSIRHAGCHAHTHDEALLMLRCCNGIAACKQPATAALTGLAVLPLPLPLPPPLPKLAAGLLTAAGKGGIWNGVGDRCSTTAAAAAIVAAIAFTAKA
jgi:hypothetical protein